jgi:hypothetical protein
VKKLGLSAGVGGAAIAVLALVLTPAIAASNQGQRARPKLAAPSFSGGTFTPAVANPRLAAEFARRGLQPGSFRFTPASASADKSKAVKVAVRARATSTAQVARDRADPAAATTLTALAPTAYNLGVSVGWKSFALSGDVAKIEGGAIPGGREAAEIGLSYNLKKFTGRVEVGAERSEPTSLKIVPQDDSYSVGVGGSYRLTRNLDVTGGVRYKIQEDRLQPLADNRRDSQAVYIGTAFRF